MTQHQRHMTVLAMHIESRGGVFLPVDIRDSDDDHADLQGFAYWQLFERGDDDVS